MNKPTLLLATLSLAFLAACGQKDAAAPAAAPAPVAAPAAAPVAENTVGKSVFGKAGRQSRLGPANRPR